MGEKTTPDLYHAGLRLMPISPEKQKLYPGGSIRSQEWRAIRQTILERAGDCCEWPGCGAPNGIKIWRAPWDREDWKEVPEGSDTSNVVRVVLTIAHLDHDPTNNEGANLKAWCQLHHNRYDARHRQANAARTRKDRK